MRIGFLLQVIRYFVVITWGICYGTCEQQNVPHSSEHYIRDDRSSNATGIKASSSSNAQESVADAFQEMPDGSPMTLKRVFLNLPGDQKAIWTSPFRLRASDSIWLVPMLGTAGVLIGGDSHSMERARSNALAISRSNSVANAGVATLVAAPGLMYVWGSWHRDAKEREAGLLTGEALVDSAAVNEALKLVLARERPTAADGQGRFFTDIGNGSFPSMHSMLGWTAASVLVHEYPGSVTQVLAYGAASLVSISRVTGRQHFPSDVVVGGALGWLIGREVYKAHHDSDVDHPQYGSFVADEKEVDPSKLGSPFVSLDSWVYPALERLAAQGYIHSQFTGLRPWTRQECMRQIDEATYNAQDLPQDSDIARSIKALRQEFVEEGLANQSFSIDSIYSRYSNIAGAPVRDSYHFGDTIWNDFGRPFDRGNNIYTGASVRAVFGRFFWYATGEYEHAPGRAALTSAQQDVVNNLDQNNGIPPNPAGPAPGPVSAIDRFYPLDMYAGMQLDQWAVTFGKQSLWLGPGESGPLMLSDNADPQYTLRLSRTTPLVLPWIFRHLGEIRADFMFSKLSGHQFPARPFFNLQKISFHPTKNLEIGFTRASLWAGEGHPFTAHSLIRNFTANGDTGQGAVDPGDRKSGFDVTYRIPGLRNWLTLYTDSYSDDDPSPLANPRRAALAPGLYLSHFPGLSRLDLRVETVSTQALTATDRGGDFLYFNNNYHDSNTNKGFVFGNQTGRDGRTYQVWSTYHFSAATTLQFGYRDTKIANGFLPGGGTQSDASSRLRWQLRPNWSIDGFVQYERWLIPVLRPMAQRDVTSSIQLMFTPHMKNLLARAD